MERHLKVFISYRRDDSAGHTGRLYDRLVSHFGKDNIFMDVDNIPAGSDFAQVIREAVSSCDVLLAVIGRGWLMSVDEEGRRRLSNENDFVRLEIATALDRGIKVIPLLVQGAIILRSGDLPGALASLVKLNALELSDTRWTYDVGRLIDSLQPDKSHVSARKGAERFGAALFFARLSRQKKILIVTLIFSGSIWGTYMFISGKWMPSLSTAPGMDRNGTPPSPVTIVGSSETIPSSTSNRTTALRPLMAGSSVGLLSPDAITGTICCFVHDREGNIFLLTSSDVLTGAPGSVVSQPSAADGGGINQKIAVLSRVLPPTRGGVNRFDGAIAKIVQGVSISQEVLGVGKITGVADRVQVGERVRISGRTSGLIAGRVVETGSTVSFDSSSGPVTFAGLVKLDSKIRAGDAGAPVLNEERQIVGFVLVGGVGAGTYVMPIKPVLQVLEVSL